MSPESSRISPRTLQMVQSMGPLPLAFGLTHANWITTGFSMLITAKFFVQDEADIRAASFVFLITLGFIAFCAMGLKKISIWASELAGDIDKEGRPVGRCPDEEQGGPDP